MPTEERARALCIGHQTGGVAGAADIFDNLEIAARDFFDRRNHLAHTAPRAGAQIDRLEPCRVLRQQMRHRGHMPRGQIGDVDIIADAGAIGRVVIRAVDPDLRARALRRLDHQWDQMGLGIVPLAAAALGIGPRGAMACNP